METSGNMPNGVLASMRTKYHTLSSVQKVVADYIFAHISEVSLLPISELAGKCDTSETTVMRFLRKLDFASYQVFRVKIAQEIPHERLESIYVDIDRGDTIETLIEKVVASTTRSIQDLQQMIASEDIRKAVELMKTAREILFIGIGSSAFIAFDAYHKFLRLGMRVTTSADSHLMSIMASQITDKDLVIAVSHSGESRDILDCVKLAKESNAGVIAFTSYRNSSITKYSDVVLLSSATETKYRSDALVSRILQLVIIDILYVAIVLEMGPDAEERLNRSRLAVAIKKR
jgi:RpiR family transcriptional regulator, carbohydrate utilization regulator